MLRLEREADKPYPHGDMPTYRRVYRHGPFPLISRQSAAPPFIKENTDVVVKRRYRIRLVRDIFLRRPDLGFFRETDEERPVRISRGKSYFVGLGGEAHLLEQTNG